MRIWAPLFLVLVTFLFISPLAFGGDTTTTSFPLRIAENGRYLLDGGGRPFRINADAAWFASTHATLPQIDIYLADRKKKGFNTIVLMALTHLTPNNREGVAPFLKKNDFSTPNEPYFAFLDAIIDKAAAQGMAVLFAYTYLGANGGDEGWWSALLDERNTLSVCHDWGVWLGNRYKGRGNIIWLAGGDYAPPAGSEGERRTLSILKGIKASGAEQLFAAQWGPPDSLATDESAFAPFIDINTIYGYGPHGNGATYDTARRAYEEVPARPVVLFEPNYEDERVGGTGLRQDVRRSQYWAVLGGATAGQNFGTKGIWNWQQPGWIDWVWNRSANWADRLDTPGSLDMKHLFSLFAALPWEDLRPSGGLRRVGPVGPDDSREFIATATTPDSDWLVAYFPPTGAGSQTAQLDMSIMSGPATARWFNPATGEYTAIDPSLPNAGLRLFSTPGNNGTGTNDWVLVLEAIAKH